MSAPDSERTELMDIRVTAAGRYGEVIFRDFEDPDTIARTGYLDAFERSELADRLRRVADELERMGAPKTP
jgi:hypothetical protein